MSETRKPQHTITECFNTQGRPSVRSVSLSVFVGFGPRFSFATSLNDLCICSDCV